MSNVDLLRSEPLGLKLLMNAYKAIGEVTALNSELVYLIEPFERSLIQEKNLPLVSI